MSTSPRHRSEPAPEPRPAINDPLEAARVQRVLEAVRRLAVQRDLGTATAAATAAVLELVDADRAYCLFHDPDTGALWTEGAGASFEGSADEGLAGLAARTGRVSRLPRADADPRYRSTVDDPAGQGSERLAVQPVIGADAEVHAVLVAVRRADRPPFSEAEGATLAALAEQWGAFIHQLALQIEADAVLEAARPERALFRREAVEAYESRQARGDVVRVSPAWLGWTYRLLVAIIVAGLVYVVVGRIDEYAEGPAVITLTGRTDVTARGAGTIASIEVVPGQRVGAGELLARLYDAEEVAELERVEREFDAQLVSVLRDPADEAARQALAVKAAEKERARARLEERLVRAPHSGLVSDVRLRPGRPLAPGDVILSLISDETDLSVVVLLPGGNRPQLRPGQSLRLELAGYRYAYQELIVDAVGDEVVGPGEVRRYLGDRLGDTLPVTGPVVLVKARLPSATFTADGKTYQYHDGMQGRAEVRIRSRTILEALVPAIERL